MFALFSAHDRELTLPLYAILSSLLRVDTVSVCLDSDAHSTTGMKKILVLWSIRFVVVWCTLQKPSTSTSMCDRHKRDSG